MSNSQMLSILKQQQQQRQKLKNINTNLKLCFIFNKNCSVCGNDEFLSENLFNELNRSYIQDDDINCNLKYISHAQVERMKHYSNYLNNNNNNNKYNNNNNNGLSF